MLIKNMAYISIALLVFCMTIMFQNHLKAQSTTAEYIEQGEKLRQEFKLQESLNAFLKAHQADPDNSEVIWRIARAYIDLAGKESSKEKQKELYLKAEKYARQGTKLDPNSSRCHTYIAVAIGKLSGFEGSKEKVRMSKEVKDEATKAIELDPKNDTAHHVLGRWHREVANLGGISKAFAKVLYGGLPKASNEEAISCFQKAIEIYPNYINHHLELAKTYIEMKIWDLALKELETVDRLPQTHQNDLKYKQEARQLKAEVARQRK